MGLLVPNSRWNDGTRGGSRCDVTWFILEGLCSGDDGRWKLSAEFMERSEAYLRNTAQLPILADDLPHNAAVYTCTVFCEGVPGLGSTVRRHCQAQVTRRELPGQHCG